MIIKFDEQWSLEKQLDMLHQNMLSALKQQVKRHQVDFVDRLLELAREAEDLILAERNYKPAPKPEECLLPEFAYREIDEPKQAKGTKTGITAVTGAPLADWANIIAQAVEAKFKELQEKPAQNKTAPPPANDDARGESADKPAASKPQKRVFSKSTEKPAGKSAAKLAETPAITPKSDKNEETAQGLEPQYFAGDTVGRLYQIRLPRMFT